MAGFTQDFVSLLEYLLPGFLCAWVFYGLTSHPKPSQFERIVQALIFTLIIQSVVYIVQQLALWMGHRWQMGVWTQNIELVCSVIVALILGGVFAYGVNSDKFHRFARYIGITRETGHPSEWFAAFLRITYVVLHLKDGRRLYGWPKEWPSQAEQGHFLLEEASWIVDDNESREQPLVGVNSILISAEDVRWVEFMEPTWETNNGKESLESSST